MDAGADAVVDEENTTGDRLAEEAMGAIRALHEAGLQAPEDVAVIGFDNYEVISANLYPELTTMQLPHYEMGKWAVETVLQISQSTGGEGPSPQMMLPCPLVMRNSI